MGIAQGENWEGVAGELRVLVDKCKVLGYASLYMSGILARLEQKRKRLQTLLKLKPKNWQEQLDEWVRVELTYSSNNIEGNTLSRRETAEVIERGVSAVIGGKPLKDQLEALNHAKAVDLVRQLAAYVRGHQFISEGDIKSIHKTILAGIDDYNAGRYRQTEVFIRGVSDVVFPEPRQVAIKMRQLVEWLEGQPHFAPPGRGFVGARQGIHPVLVAADVHFEFVTIHPFVDGNGRTGRLLMNLVLLMNGYPLAIIRAEERQQYLESLRILQTKNDGTDYYHIIYKAVERSLDAYLSLVQGKPALAAFGEVDEIPADQKLLRIGEVAKLTNETVPTIRYWTKEGLLHVVKYSPGGYQLYTHEVVTMAKKIRTLQEKERLTIVEIKKSLDRSR